MWVNIFHWLKPQPPTRENIDSSWTSQYLPDFKSYLGSTNQGAVGVVGLEGGPGWIQKMPTKTRLFAFFFFV